MKNENHGEDLLCQVLGFKFLSGNEKFAAMSCPIKVSEEKSRGVAVLCNFFSAQHSLISFSKQVAKYININHYKRHVNVKRNLGTGELFCIYDENANQL